MARTYKPCNIPLPLIYDASKELPLQRDSVSFYHDNNERPLSSPVNYIRKNKFIGKSRPNSEHTYKHERKPFSGSYVSEYRSTSEDQNKSNCCHHVKTKGLVTNGQELNYYEKILAHKMQVESNLFQNNGNDIVSLYRDNKRYSRAGSKMDWNNYHDLETIHKFMDELEFEYPSICSTAVIGTSLEGRILKIIKISNSNAGNSAVWMDAGIHAREWIAPATATFLCNHIARNFDSLPDCMTNKDWYFLPVVNPDGYVYSHKHDRMWRKNRAFHKGQCVGVDLNRNFSVGWGGKESSDNPHHNFYRGPAPFSEPESSAMRDAIMNSGITFKVYLTLHSYGQMIMFPFAFQDNPCPDYTKLLQGATVMSKDAIMNSGITFKVYLTLHSYGQMIMFPFAFQDNPCPDYTKLLQGATVMSKAIYDSNRNIYKVGISRDVMYGAAGTSSDWCYGVAGVPFCYLIELRSKAHRFLLPREEIQLTGSEILSSVSALMNFVDNYRPPKLRKACATVDWNRSDISLNNFFPCRLLKLFKVASLKSTQVWEVQFSMEGQRLFVKNLDTIGAINIWKEERSTMDIMVEGTHTRQVAGLLHERDIPFSIAVKDVEELLASEQGNKKETKRIRKTSAVTRPKMDWNGYHRLSVIYAFLEDLAAEYPYLCTVSVIGKTYEGRDMKMLKVSNGEAGNPGVWIDGGIHPREWISTAVVTYFADKLVRNFSDMASSVSNKDWYILPVLNPDGYEYTHTHDRMWRKNRAVYGECIGVDLNRNFGYGWGQNGEEGSSDDPGNIFFRGSKAFSEPETQAVRKVIAKSNAEFKVYLSFHSYGEVIIFPWGYTGDACPTYVELLEGGTAIAKAIFETSGHTYKVGSTKDLMYYAAGTSSDWAYGTANIPYAYMVELRGKQHRFLLPKEEIVPTANEVMSGILRLMDFVDRRCQSTQSCVCPKRS